MTVEFVRCVGCSSTEGRAAKLGLLEVENHSIPTTVEFVRCVGCSRCERRDKEGIMILSCFFFFLFLDFLPEIMYNKVTMSL